MSLRTSPDGLAPKTSPSLAKVVALAAAAGGMGWGIRGQYGHETGAMMAGLLVALVLALLFRPRAASLPVARAVAWCAVGIGIGGSMTYGQTVGLTHDAPLIGNWAALRWGLLGLSIKGAIWIGFAGVFFGMGLGGKRYRPLELAVLWLALLGLCALGIWALNTPFDPEHRLLPRIYFSDDWRWEPGADLKPRREIWGGLLFALAGLFLYTRFVRRDGLALCLGFWGVLGGAIGFPLGQSIQAFHAWNPELFRGGVWAWLDPRMNWWNHMETTFGATMGACLGLGAWLHRARLAPLDDAESRVAFRPLAEWGLLAAHVAGLLGEEFFSTPYVEELYDFGMVLAFIPIVAVAGGRLWPYFVMLPVTALPIAGKTLRQLAFREPVISPALGACVYVAVPLVALTAMAIAFARAPARREAAVFLRPTLLVATWLYFGLNYAFFRFPWPWAEWTSRTPNGIVYTICAAALTWAAVRRPADAPTEARHEPEAVTA